MDVGEGTLVVTRKPNGSGRTIAAGDFHKAACTEENPHTNQSTTKSV